MEKAKIMLRKNEGFVVFDWIQANFYTVVAEKKGHEIRLFEWGLALC